VRPHDEVPLSGDGLSLEDQAAQLIDILDEGLSQGLLTGVGNGASAPKRTDAFRHMLEEALTLIAGGDIGEACDQLYAALIHADGEPQPGDFIAVAERASLASEIVDLRSHLGCGN
jgi:hypothetical protein